MTNNNNKFLTVLSFFSIFIFFQFVLRVPFRLTNVLFWYISPSFSFPYHFFFVSFQKLSLCDIFRVPSLRLCFIVLLHIVFTVPISQRGEFPCNGNFLPIRFAIKGTAATVSICHRTLETSFGWIYIEVCREEARRELD